MRSRFSQPRIPRLISRDWRFTEQDYLPPGFSYLVDDSGNYLLDSAGHVMIVRSDYPSGVYTVGGGGSGETPSLTVDPSIDTPTMTLASISTYPPELDFVLDQTILVNDTLRVQASTVRDFSTALFPDIVVQLTSAAVSGSNPVSVASSLASISSPAKTYFRSRIERTSTATCSNWSAVIEHGDTVAPTITSAATASFVEGTPVSYALTADKYAMWTITGTDSGYLEVYNNSVVRLLSNAAADYASKTNYSFIINALGDNGLASDLPVTWTITSLDRTPDQFTFSGSLNAAVSTPFVSNTITITGVNATVTDIAATVSGAGIQYQITRGGVAGAWTNAGAFTTKLNDQITLRGTTPANYNSSLSGTLTVGSVSSTWSVVTVADPAKPIVTPVSQPNHLDYSLGGFTTNPTRSVNTVSGINLFYLGGGGGTITSVTIGGVAATQITTGSSLWTVNLSSGGTQTLSVSTSAGWNTLSYYSVGVSNVSTFTNYNWGANGFTSDPHSYGSTMTIPATKSLGIIFVLNNTGGSLSMSTDVSVISTDNDGGGAAVVASCLVPSSGNPTATTGAAGYCQMPSCVMNAP